MKNNREHWHHRSVIWRTSAGKSLTDCTKAPCLTVYCKRVMVDRWTWVPTCGRYPRVRWNPDTDSGANT